MKIPSIKRLQLELSTSRIQALSDGIFAIAMTLLVLNLEIAEPGSKNSYFIFHEELTGIWRHLIHYVEAFLILAFFWTKHHQQFHFIKKSDRMLLWLNIFILLFVSLIPFSTSLASDFANVKLAAIFFEVNMFMAGCMYYIHWHYATYKHRLVDKDLDKAIIVTYKKSLLVMPLFSIVAIIVSLFTPRYGTMAYMIVPVYIMLSRLEGRKK